MQKIVLNKCYGGFGLSNKAIELYLKLKGKEAFFYKQTKYRHEDGEALYERLKNPYDETFLTYVFTKDKGESYTDDDRTDNFRKDCFYYYDIARDDATLVEVVEKLGTEASGSCARLKVVEIDDGERWQIDEYDGIESLVSPYDVLG